MRVTFDTNILAYAEGVGDAARRDSTMELLGRLPAESVLLPAQVLGELYRVLTGKAQHSPDTTRSIVLQWADSFEVVDSTWTAFQAAFDLTVDHGLQIWDALILAVTAENRCRMLLTEDLQHGFTWRGVTVVNPYRIPSHPLLTPLLLR
ncbi:PIN domain-containing protein [Geobacter argillaceus]|uniref:Putative nucleic acid-binding protein n=1 Tax=Geobacter argillaceus TaxID=345631 RepID=A0A562VP14_9BACT|nr:PIN domain-containing protein [Geobacter argillaceus]TWJ19650.1 putative nucleic acid-binding protein [Geobacter argillaceus]